VYEETQLANTSNMQGRQYLAPIISAPFLETAPVSGTSTRRVVEYIKNHENQVRPKAGKAGSARATGHREHRGHSNSNFEALSNAMP